MDLHDDRDLCVDDNLHGLCLEWTQGHAGTAASVSAASSPSIGSGTTARPQSVSSTMTSDNRPANTDPYTAHGGYQNYVRQWYSNMANKEQQDDGGAQRPDESKARRVAAEHESSSGTFTQPATHSPLRPRTLVDQMLHQARIPKATVQVARTLYRK